MGLNNDKRSICRETMVDLEFNRSPMENITKLREKTI